MKRILFPTDFSEIATNAFIHVLQFAKVMQAEIIVLHSYELLEFDEHFFHENYSMIYDAVELSQFDMFKEEVPKMHKMAEDLNADQIKMTHRLMEGTLVDNVKKAIVEDKIDFVIMGTSGITSWDAFFVGSNSGSVLIGIEVPMLCVPLAAKYRPIKNIGFTTRYRSKDKKPLSSVLEIAKKLNAKVKCLYVKSSTSDVSSETIDYWGKEYSSEPVSFDIVNSDDIKKTVLDFVSVSNIDVLTMLTYKRGFFEGLFVPSYGEKSQDDIDIPVLAIHSD
ncbi:universal stress protein [Flavobacterium degerlachei]|jgi:nucleotide-binding universal stress UspA family protein|uniref:Nucleotide-binding universal stress protein, UspA family n=1 Tax=Flavobacterium degerlachei TaxID=229203 RepID=A0A1H3BWK9_9FLAO|nr:universal stress protein [Flavobacterium degerlachei]SDX46342.1 Nucleotide-binding universal stress protein, UspA family [Flavobacterium degerlachei]